MCNYKWFRNSIGEAALVVGEVISVDKIPELRGRVFGAVMAYLGEVKKKPGGPPFVAYHNINMQALDVEASFPVLAKLPGKGDIKPTTIPGGEVAMCMHTGSYESIRDTYAVFMAWVKEQGASQRAWPTSLT